ncbi:hypothetical protein HDV06_001593 [Boothiomyces sp. JEL0866]|nr:hypothetical protein HDV06_001593 [Boothiomyces sp. JEL0866]
MRVISLRFTPRKLVLFIIIFSIYILTRQKDISVRTVEPISNAPYNINKLDYRKPEYPKPDGAELKTFTNELFPPAHNGYMLQNGPRMVQRTMERQQDKIKIMIDPNLKNDFKQLYNNNFCPSQPSCEFSYTDDYELVSDQADSYITNITKGILVKDAALHFTKTVYLSSNERPTGRWLRSRNWYGTDIFASHAPVPIYYQGELFARPMHFPIYNTNITRTQLLQQIDFNQKIPMVTIIFEDGYCSEYTNKYQAYQLAKNVSAHMPVKIFPLACRLFSWKSPLDSACGDDLDCFIKKSSSAVIIDTRYEDDFVPTIFWKTISYGTSILYLWRHQIWKLAPPHITRPMLKFELSNEDIEFLIEMTEIDALEFGFSFKKTGLTKDMEKVLNFSTQNFPCRLCEHVAIRKQSTKCMLDLVGNEELQNVQSVNEYLPSEQRINGLGALEGLVDSVHIMHYSKAPKRREFITKLFKKMQIEANFILGFDKQVIPDGFQKCVVGDREAPAYLKRQEDGHTLSGGELSLSVKSFYAYYQLLVNNHKNTLTIEDDIWLHPTASETTVANVLKYVPPNYSIIQLGQCLASKVDPFDKGKERKQSIRQLYAHLGDWRHCTSSYVISKTGAILMFKSLPLSFAIDLQMMGARIEGGEDHGAIENPDHSMYGVWPAIFVASEDINMQSYTGIRAVPKKKKE